MKGAAGWSSRGRELGGKKCFRHDFNLSKIKKGRKTDVGKQIQNIQSMAIINKNPLSLFLKIVIIHFFEQPVD